MHVNIDCFMLFVTLWKSSIDSNFPRISCDRKRKAFDCTCRSCSSASDGPVTCGQVTSVQGLTVPMVVLSANEVLWHGA